MKLLTFLVVVASVNFAFGQNRGGANSENSGDQGVQNSQDAFDRNNGQGFSQQGNAQSRDARRGQGDQPMATDQQGDDQSRNFASSENPNDNRWRYRHYNGEWWYWMPGNYWMYHRGDQWNRYDASTFQPLPVVVQSTPTFNDGYSYRNYGPGYYGRGDYGPGYGYGYGRGYGNGQYGYGSGYRGYGPYGSGGYNPYFSGNPNVRTGAAIGGALGGGQGAYIGGAIGGAAGGGRGGRR
jgi:hypothetical protein